MTNQDAGAAIAYLPNSSPDLGQSGAADAKPRTEASDLNAALDGLLDGSRGSGKLVRCRMGQILQVLPDDAAERLRHLVDHGIRADGSPVPAVHIAQTLTDAGYPCRPASVTRHRRRLASTSAERCTCE